MHSPKELIDAAAKVVGGYSALAKHLEVAPQTVNNWKGATSCPLYVQAQLAALAGLDWKAHVCEVVARKAGKALTMALAGVAVTLALFGGNGLAPSAAGDGFLRRKPR